jgi:hypothetical protein
MNALLFVLTLLAADPFNGTWKLNLKQSKVMLPPPKSQVMRIQSDAEKVTMNEEVIAANGQRFNVKFTANFDGRDYVIEGTPLADTIAFTRPDKRVLEGTAKKRGQIVVREKMTVAPNGRRIAHEFSVTDGAGVTTPYTAVWDRTR